MARPKGNKKTWVISLWVEETEKASLRAKAKAAGVSIGEYLLAGRREGKPETEEEEVKPDSNREKVSAPEIKPVSNKPETVKRTLTAAEMMRGVR